MGANPRVVLIDDNVAWLETLAEYLRERGLAPVAVSDPHQGLAVLETTQAAVAVIDLHMPGMDGLELLRRLRRRDVAVFMLSSDDEPTVASRALAAGARAFLRKNGSIRPLLRALQEALKEARRTGLPIWQRLLPRPRHGDGPRALLTFRR
jgi:CheY-like chemotaxis protein